MKNLLVLLIASSLSLFATINGQDENAVVKTQIATAVPLLVVNIAFGVMTRAAPQLNIFAIGFPLTLVLGLVIVWLGMADILAQYQDLAREALLWLRELAQVR